MTNSDYTAICLVVDRSGSMMSMRDEAEAGVNAFVADQAQESGRRTVRIVKFDQQYSVVCPSTDARDVAAFKLEPRGMTALHDAMGRGITEFGAELAALSEDERPGTVIFAVMTDGMENASQEWDAERVKALVTQQQDQWGWHVLYLGANQDAVLEAQKLGVRSSSSLTYAATPGGMASSLRSASSYAVAASSGIADVSFTDEDRASAVDDTKQ